MAAAAVAAIFAAGQDLLAAERIVFRITTQRSERARALIDEAIDLFQQQHGDIEVLVERRRAVSQCRWQARQHAETFAHRKLPQTEHLEQSPPEVELLLRELFTGDRPDVMDVPSWLAVELARRKAVIAVPPELMQPGANDCPADVIEACRLYAEPGGTGPAQLAGVPWLADTIQLVYNAHLFTEARISPDNPPILKEDMPRICRLLHERLADVPGKPCALGLAAAPPDVCRTFSSFLYGEGGRFSFFETTDEAYRTGLNSEAGRRAMAAMQRLMPYAGPRTPALSTVAVPELTCRGKLIERFAAGRAAIIFGSMEDLDAILDLSPQLDVRTVAAPSAVELTSPAVISVLVLPKPLHGSTQRSVAAGQLASFLAGPEVQKLLMTGGETGRPFAAPASRSLVLDDWYDSHPVYRPFARGLLDCEPVVPGAGWKQAEARAVGRDLSEALQGKGDPKAGLDRAAEKANWTLASFYGQVGHAPETTGLGLFFLAAVLFVVMVVSIGLRR